MGRGGLAESEIALMRLEVAGIDQDMQGQQGRAEWNGMAFAPAVERPTALVGRWPAKQSPCWKASCDVRGQMAINDGVSAD